MASTDNCSRQRTTTIVGRRTWLFTGTSLVAMGTVVIAAAIALQQQLHRSKCHVPFDCNSQSMNAKTPGIWFGIPIVFYGLLTLSAGICRRKTMMIMLAILSVSFILLNLKHLLLSEVSIMSSCSNHNNYSSQGRENETNGGGGPQPIATEDDRASLRFSPEDRIIALEKMLHMRGDHGKKLDWKSSNNNEQSMKYQHQPDANAGAKSEGVRYENTEERDHGMDQDSLNQKSSEEKAVKLEEKLLSSTDVSSNDVTANKVTTTLASESIEAEGDDDSIYESSGSGKGLDDDEDYDDENNDYGEKVVDGFEAVGEEPERDEYDSYDSELKDVEGNKTAEEEEPLSSFSDWYEKRRKRDLGGREGREEEDCVEEDEINLQWFIQLMHCLMAVVRFIVLVLSIVMATLILAPCCCYQKDEMEASAEKFSGMQSVTPVAATEKDDATLLQV